MKLKMSNLFKKGIGDAALAIFYIVTIYLYVINFGGFQNIIDSESVLLSIWNEITNVATVVPVVVLSVINIGLRNVGTRKNKIVRFVKGAIGTILFWFYRVAVTLDLSASAFAIVGFAQFLILIILDLMDDTDRNNCASINYNGIIKKAIGYISNRNILSIQLFCVSQKTNNNIEEFIFKCIDHMENVNCDVDCDINCMMMNKLEISKEEYDGFGVARLAYDAVMENGSDAAKTSFLKTAEDAKQQLIHKLKSLSIDDINKTNCCEARLILCYSNLESMVETPTYSVAAIEDGSLGISEEIDRRLFTVARTGLLGAVLFGKNMRYSFKHSKAGIKNGRQYSASMLDCNKDKIICLMTIAERNGKSSASASLFQYITNCENKIVETIKKEKVANA